MSDPFADVDAAPPHVVDQIIAALETRAADPAMTPIVDAYLDALEPGPGARIVEIGAGTGGIARRIAARFPAADVLATDPSDRLVAHARTLADGLPNLTFDVQDGTALALDDACAEIALLHTVLSHVADPTRVVAEALRIVKPGGRLVVCDADFSKATLGLVPGDPLGACAAAFVDGAVLNPWLVGRLRALVEAVGLTVEHFAIDNRVVTEGPGVLAWVRMSCTRLVADGVIGQPLAEALEAEYERRAAAGRLYGFLPFATLIARRPMAVS